MSIEPLKYNYDSEHFILPHRRKYKPLNGSQTEYIGTVVLRDFRDVEKRNKDVKYDVYFIEYWKGSGIRQWSDKEMYFLKALNSPDDFEPVFDCDTIRFLAQKGYYFVDEKTGGKSLRCFNVRWHNYTRKHRDKQYNTIISLDHYPCCGYFNSCGMKLKVKYENGIPINIERLEVI